MTFYDTGGVYDVIKSKQEYWVESLMPAMFAVYERTSTELHSESDIITEMDCLEMLVSKLKPKSTRLSTKERISQIVCVAESLDACKRKHPTNDPFVAVVGAMEAMDGCALICDHRVVLNLTKGCNLASILLVLIAFCHTFNVKYSSEVEDVMEFFQDKLVKISEKTKHGVAYMNMYRAISSSQQKILSENDKEDDSQTVDSDTTIQHIDIPESQVSLFSC
jgi:hypothetical protein